MMRCRIALVWLLALATVLSGVVLPTDADARGFRRSRFRSSRRSWGGSRRRSTYKPRRRTTYKPRKRTTYKPRKRTTYKPRSNTRRPSSRSPSRSTRSRPARRYRSSRRRRALPYSSRRRSRRLFSRSVRNRGRWMGTGYSRSDAYARAARAGLAFATMTLAMQHFLAHRDGRYPTSFPSEPRTRPKHIPEYVVRDGASLPVVWDAAHTRYAVRKDGKLLPFDPLTDPKMVPKLLASAGYYWGPKPSGGGGGPGAGWVWIIALVIGAGIFLVIIVVGFVIRRSMRKSLQGATSAAIAGPQRRGRQAIGPPPGPRQHEPDHPDYWLHLGVGDMIAVNDMQAWEDVLEGAHGSSFGIDFQVQSLVRMRAATNTWDAVLCQLHHLEQQPGEQPLWMLVFKERGVTRLSVYYAPEGFVPGTRADLLDREQYWLFEEPDRDDWRPSELRFNPEITHTGTKRDGSEVEQRFAMLPGGAAIGGATSEPGPRTLDAVQLVRWRCPDAEKNPLMLVVEQGGTGRAEGGRVRLLLGAEVRTDELDVTPGGPAS